LGDKNKNTAGRCFLCLQIPGCESEIYLLELSFWREVIDDQAFFIYITSSFIDIDSPVVMAGWG